jgi:hypothetical protein
MNQCTASKGEPHPQAILVREIRREVKKTNQGTDRPVTEFNDGE